MNIGLDHVKDRWAFQKEDGSEHKEVCVTLSLSRHPDNHLGGDHVLRDQAHCIVVARGGDQSLFEQLTLINTGKHRSCLCAERGAEVKATFLATGLFPSL